MKRVNVTTAFKLIAISLPVFCALGGGVLANSLIPSASAEENIGDNLGTIDPSKYSVSIASTGSISPIKLKLETVPDTNVIRAGQDTITTTITAPSSTSSNCKLYLSTDSTTSNALTNTTTPTNTIPATSGTILSPIPLTGSSWGFALNNNTTDTPGIAPNGFDANYNEKLPAVNENSKWAAVPTKGNEVMIQTIPMNQSTTDTNIYYAISAMDTLAEGTYNGSIVYTAIYEATDIPTGELTLTPTSGTAGDEITLNSSIVPTMEDIGALDIKLVDPATSTQYPCENITTTKTASGNLQAKCNIPNLPNAGNYNVVATYNKTGATYTSTEQFTYKVPAIPCSQRPDVQYLDGLEYFQDFNSTHKDNMELDKTYKAKDKRDNKEYCFSKLEDSNVWMTDNLRLGSATQDTQLTPSDSNVSTNWTLPARALDYNWTGSYTVPEFYPSDDIQEDETKGAVGYYGYYYNWNAATAGTGKSTRMEAQYDICPKGWSLPSNYSTEEGKTRSYSKLLYSHGVISDIAGSDYATDGYNKITSAPLQFVLSGEHNSSGTSVHTRGSYGNYWSSSTSNNTTSAYELDFVSSYVRPQDYNDKRYGYVVRCLAL